MFIQYIVSWKRQCKGNLWLYRWDENVLSTRMLLELQGTPGGSHKTAWAKVWQDVISCSSNVALGGCIWGEINQCMSRRCWTEHGQLQLRNTLWFPCGEIIISFYNSDTIFLLYVTSLCLYIQYCVQLFSSSLKDIGEVSGTRGWLWKSWNSSLLQRDSKGWNSSVYSWEGWQGGVLLKFTNY